MNGSPDKNEPIELTTGDFLRQVQAGGRGSYADLYARISPSLLAWVRIRVSRSLRGFAQPEDVIQEVWWRAMESFSRFDASKTSFRAWLFQIATHVLLEWNRQRERRDRVERHALQDGLGPNFGPMPDPATAASEAARLSDSVQKLIEFIQSLEPSDQVIFTSCGLEGLTAAEVALELGLKPEAVTKRWQRMRERIKDHSIWREFDPSLD